MDENFKVGNFICELRKEKGLSQAALGERLHVTNKAVSRWETGRGLPDSALLLPLSEILGVTVDEILRGELRTTPVVLKQERAIPIADIERVNRVLAFRAAKKLLIRDSIIVLPILLFTVVWLTMTHGFGILSGTDYWTNMMFGLVLPLFLIGSNQIVYAAFLIRDTVKMKEKKRSTKILICIGVWYAVNYLFVFVYIRRIYIYIKRMREMKTVTAA